MREYQKISKWSIGAYVLYVITGLLMFIWPNLTIELLGKALGVGMLVVGIVHIILYFTKDHIESILHMDLTIGVVLAAFGAFMLIHSDFVGMTIPFGIGILLLIGGITKIQYALDMRRLQFLHWKVMLILAGLLIIMGALLIYDPFKERLLIYLIAASLVVEGISSIISVLIISHRMKQLAKGWIPKHKRPGYQGKVPRKAKDQPREIVEEEAAVPQTESVQQIPGQQILNGPSPGDSAPASYDPVVPDQITLEMPKGE